MSLFGVLIIIVGCKRYLFQIGISRGISQAYINHSRNFCYPFAMAYAPHTRSRNRARRTALPCRLCQACLSTLGTVTLGSPALVALFAHQLTFVHDIPCKPIVILFAAVVNHHPSFAGCLVLRVNTVRVKVMSQPDASEPQRRTPFTIYFSTAHRQLPTASKRTKLGKLCKIRQNE